MKRKKSKMKNGLDIIVGGWNVRVLNTSRGVRVVTGVGAPDREICDYLKREGFLVVVNNRLETGNNMGT